MRAFLERLSIAGALRALAILAVGGLVAVFLLTWLPLRSTQVNGSAYREIVDRKELQADVSQPRLYVIEPWLLVIRMSQEYDAARRDALAGELQAARARFDAGSAAWRGKRLSQPERDALDSVLATGRLIFDAGEALKKSMDDGDAMASLQAMDRGKEAFAEHQLAVMDIGGKVDVAVKEGEASVDRRTGAGMTALALAVLVLACGVGFAALIISRTIGGALGRLRSTLATITEGVRQGQLDVRGKLEDNHPDFRDLVAGVNDTLDAFELPFRATVVYVSTLAQGELPARNEEAAQGEFDLLRVGINELIDTMQALVDDSSMLAQAGMEGRLSVRANADRHQGDFRKLVQGINGTLDAVIKPLGVAAAFVEQVSRGQVPEKIEAAWAGDFGKLKVSLNLCVDAIQALVADADMLAQAGVEGRLSTRAEAGRHQGDFRRIVEGVNRTLDSVTGPLGVAARYVEDISQGRIPPRITEAYQGDFARLRDNLNGCLDAVRRLTGDVQRLSEAAVAGQLQTRADVSAHRGEFAQIVDGVNATLDAVMAPIDEAAAVLESLARRDLRARVKGNYQGDHARIKEAVNATGEALHDALAQVADAVEQVSGAATQIASSSQAVASGASQQASALQQTTSSIDAVAGITRQAAGSAQQANTLAQSARGAASEGATAVAQMQGAMNKIRASAESTSQIIKDINEIAFQTNLLALNAAVEAARAGEAGRGFAVVAEEVRSLALRSKEAAQKTEALIKESVRQAGEGEVTARQVAGKLGEIVGGIGKVSDLVSEIASAAKEQSVGIDQVSRAVTEMDKVTQQNAASSEESSSAASELSAQAEELAAMVGAFQLSRREERALEPSY